MLRRASLLALVCAAAAAGCSRCESSQRGAAATLDAGLSVPPLARATVDLEPAGGTVPSDFLGLSIEYGKSLRNGLGHSLTRPNEVFWQLMANLPSSVLRVGGNSTDESCFENIDVPTPNGCVATITSVDLSMLAATAQATHWRFLLGVNLAQRSPAYAKGYALKLIEHLPLDAIAGLEIGNEPDFYATHELYTPDGDDAPVYMRKPSYSPEESAREYDAIADALRGDPRTHDLPLAGPALAAKWGPELATKYLPLVGPSRIDLVTTHHYPLSACRADRPLTDPRYPSLQNLLAPRTMARVAGAIESDVAAAKTVGRPLQIDETNSISCRGVEGVSDTFASAVWGVDYFFTAAQAGVARVNLHGGSETARYSPITPHALEGAGGREYIDDVHPLYYAMLLFAYAEGGALLPVHVEGVHANVKAWAVAPKCAAGVECPAMRVFLVNKDEQANGAIEVAPSSPLGRAEAIVLESPSLQATDGTTLGGRAVDAETGRIDPPEVAPIAAQPSGAYRVELRRASVVMLSIFPR